MKVLCALGALLMMITSCFGQHKEGRFSGSAKKDLSMQYILHEPSEIKEDRSYPLIVFLHGAGERGDNLDLVTVHGPMRYLREGGQIEAFVLSPQCPDNIFWDTETIYHLILEILEKNPVDNARVYLTGLSMGGWGTWKLAMEHPGLFAAIAPVCGVVDRSFRSTAYKLKDMPIWVFHGALDNVVSIDDSRKMIGYLKEHGNTPKFTVYPMAYHDSWTETYSNQELYKWLLAQSL